MRAKRRSPSVEAMVDAGCSEESIRIFIMLGKDNNKEAQFKVLERHRRTLLAQVHDYQNKIDTLDYLVYQMKKNG